MLPMDAFHDFSPLPPSHYSVKRAAGVLGVSARRVREMLADGDLAGHREGWIWLVERTSVVSRANRNVERAQPLAAENLELLVEAIAQHLGAEPLGRWAAAAPGSRFRARKRLQKLLDEDRPAWLLRAWAAREPKPAVVRVTADVAAEIEREPMVHVSGLSHPLSQMSSSMEVEVHAPASLILRLQRAPRGQVSVIAHLQNRPWSIGEVALDLALHNGAREDNDVRRILAKPA